MDRFFDDGILNAEDMEVLDALRHNSKAAICVSDDEFNKISSEITKEASDWSDKTFCAVSRMLDRASSACDDEGVKIASAKSDTLKNIMTYIGVGSLAAIPAARAIDYIKTNKRIDESWDSLVENHPDIASNPHTPGNWSVLEDFAPDIAANRHAAKAIIGTMNEYGETSPKLISDLISMQKGLSEGKPGFGGGLDPISSVSKIQGMGSE